ncbi:MAG: hypothetical protein JSU85_11955, partial [Candidatus Zixiibacteriota bacterium]
MRIRFLGKTSLKLIIFTGLILLVFSNYGQAQNEGDTIWTRVYDAGVGQEIHSVEQTSDGGFVAAGYIGGSETADFLLLKTDSNGDMLWFRKYGAVDENEQAQSVKQTYDGGYIVVGWVKFRNIFDYWNIYMVRTDANGDTIWTWKYAGEGYAYGYDVEETPDNGFVIVGKTGDSATIDDYDAYLIKLDAAGDTVWTRVYGDHTNQDLYDVELTSDGGYVVTGHYGDCSPTCPGSYDVLLMKVAANGDSLWGHTYGDSLVDIGYSVKATSDGGYIIAGSAESWTPGEKQAYFIKTNSNGDTLWTRLYGAGTFNDEAHSICETYSGNYATAGYSELPDRNIEFYFLKLDPNGDTLWTGLYGSPYAERAYSVIQVTDGSFLMAGSTDYFGPPRQKGYLVNIAGPVLYG